MVTYSPHPVFIDGVRLDSAAWNIETKTRSTAPIRTADVVLPGVDGVAASLDDDLDASVRTYTMWVRGSDADGLIPVGTTALENYLSNLDSLTHLFGTRHRLLDHQELWAGGVYRQAWVKVVDPIAPDMSPSAMGRFSVSLLIPEGLTQDVNSSDWASSGTVVSTVTYEVTTLQGATGPINDATILVTGPVNNPVLKDWATGATCQLNANLAAGQAWRLNCKTWATRYGAGLTLGSTDTDGTDAQALTVFGGGKSSFLRLVPGLSGGLRRVQLSLTGASITSSTAIAVRARRKFLI